MHKDSLKTITGYLSRFVRISDRVTLTQPRHLEAARRAVSHLKDALKTIDTYSPDVCATDLQAAQAALSEITGDNADEKLLDTVFSTFCVGK
jgi:tRNA modification GTPase